MSDNYETREKLMEAVENAIVQNENGQYSLSLPSNNENSFSEEVAQLRKSNAHHEQLIKELKQKTATQKQTITELSRLNPSELQEKLKQFAQEKAEWSIARESLEKEMEPLKAELTAFREKERQDLIRQALHTAAVHQGIRPEAIRDVERLAVLLSINDDGIIETSEGLTVEKLVEKEKALSPHWIPVSQGGGSQTVTSNMNDIGKEARFEAARQKKDFTGMILNAPIIE